MNEEGLEKMDRCGADPGDQDVCSDVRRLYSGGSCAGGGSVAPCAFCEWCGICAQHADQPGHRTAGGRGSFNRTA